MLDTQPKIVLSNLKPRIRFRDYRCVKCGRMLMRASLDNAILSIPLDFQKIHPLIYIALKSIIVEIRCAKCGATSSFSPLMPENGLHNP